MNCRNIDTFLDSRFRNTASSLPPEAARHIEDCERCRGLMHLVERPPARWDLSDPLRERIVTCLWGSLEPVSPIPRAGLRILCLAAVFMALAAGGIFLLGTGAVHAMALWQWAGVAGILTAGSVLVAVSLGLQMAPGSCHRVPPAPLIVAVISAFVLAAALLLPWRSGALVSSRGLGCSLTGLSVAVPAAVLFWLLLRRGAVLSPVLLGASTGLLAGLVGATVLHFECAVVEAQHHVVWHAGIAVASTLAGFLLGRFGQKRRSQPMACRFNA